KADPNYQEFAGDDHDFTFMLDRDSDAKLWIDQFYDDNHSMFKFRFNDDSLNLTDLQDWAAVDWKKHLKDLDIDVDALIHRFDRNGSGSHYTKDSKKIRVSEIEGDELGKKGIVKKNEKLELNDLVFLPNPSENGKIKVKFEVPEEGELSIKVYNLKEQEIFNRYFERFGGFYAESIDLSGQEEGMYLLEIVHNKQRLTKKVLIN
ncbi:MAG: T9SS type A sorting domain-containing protein, partial [Bacteroidota bacterium]